MLDSNFSGQELRLFRESQKVSQAKLAKETSIVQAKISSFELDKGILSDEDKAKIFQFFSNSSKVEKVVKAKKRITKQSNFAIRSLDVDERKKKYALSPKNKKYVFIRLDDRARSNITAFDNTKPKDLYGRIVNSFFDSLADLLAKK